jgi:hypothetical protein
MANQENLKTGKSRAAWREKPPGGMRRVEKIGWRAVMFKTGRPKYKTKGSNFSEVLARRVPPLSRAKRKLSEDFQDRICMLIAAGYGMPVATDMFGCSRQAIHQLAQRDQAFAQKVHDAYELVRSKSWRFRITQEPRWVTEWLLNRITQEEGGRKKKAMTDEDIARILDEIPQEKFIEIVRDRSTRRQIREEMRRLAKEDAKKAKDEADE